MGERWRPADGGRPLTARPTARPAHRRNAPARPAGAAPCQRRWRPCWPRSVQPYRELGWGLRRWWRVLVCPRLPLAEGTGSGTGLLVSSVAAGLPMRARGVRSAQRQRSAQRPPPARMPTHSRLDHTPPERYHGHSAGTSALQSSSRSAALVGGRRRRRRRQRLVHALHKSAGNVDIIFAWLAWPHVAARVGAAQLQSWRAGGQAQRLDLEQGVERAALDAGWPAGQAGRRAPPPDQPTSTEAACTSPAMGTRTAW